MVKQELHLLVLLNSDRPVACAYYERLDPFL